MLRKIFLLLYFFSMTLFAKEHVTIALAANVSYAIDALKQAYLQHHKDTTIDVIIGGSGNLKAQIQRGAPYDIFMSANMAYPYALMHEKKTLTQPKIYAQGSLALLSVQPRDFSKGIQTILNPTIHHIAVANPKTAPYGKAAQEALQNTALYTQVKDKLIFGDSISQTVAFTLRAADIGFIAKSSLYSPKMKHFKEHKNWISLDTTLYTPIDQGIVLLEHARNNAAAHSFYKFILSEEAKNIFKHYGYQLP